ncbi:WG repeat-containing protein [Verrucosispora sp. WMMA2044]|uniref:WG repeat-containing protein n=1 Tax=Verrucosispora sp. WMMA2044 TaxID=3016419 RepID=UPI00248C1B73|nr:WG repeat-containing protein [Verrucosispora sp. WMMA2044]WBB49863.1 WG repeat-containing protein [Verrucosispora sp. WMMA2044]
MSRGYADRWHDPAEPSWVVEPTSEWQPQFPGQRYPGDIGAEHQPPPPRGRASAVGRAEVPPLAPTRPDGTYVGRSWDDEPDGWPGRHEIPDRRPAGSPNGAQPYDRSVPPGSRTERARTEGRRSSYDDAPRGRDGVVWSDFGPQASGAGAPPRRDRRDPDRYVDRRDPRESDRRDPDRARDQRDPDRYARRDPQRYAGREPERRDPDRRDDRYPRPEPERRSQREPESYPDRPRRRAEPTGRDEYRRGAPVSPAARPEPGWVAETDEERRPAAAHRPTDGVDRRPPEDVSPRPRYQWSHHPGQPARADSPVVDGYRGDFVGGGDPDAAPYPDGYVDDEPVRTPADEWVRPDRDRRWGAPQPSTPDPQEYGAPSRGDLPWPAPGPLRPSSGRDHREYQRPTPQERDVDRRPGGPPDGAEPERFVDRPAAALPEPERPVSGAPDQDPRRRHLSVVPDHPVSPAPERNRPVSPAPEWDRPVSPAAGRARPVSPAPQHRQPGVDSAPHRRPAAPVGDLSRPGPDRAPVGRPDHNRTDLPGQDRERPAASAAGRAPTGDAVRPAPLHQHEVRPAPLHEHQVRPAPLHDQPVVASPPPTPAPSVAAAPPVAAPPARPVSAPPTQPPVPAPPAHRPVSAPPAQPPVPAPSGRISGAVADPAPVGPPPEARPDPAGSGPGVPTAPPARQPTRYVPPPPEPSAPGPARPPADAPQSWFGPATEPPPAAQAPPAAAPPPVQPAPPGPDPLAGPVSAPPGYATPDRPAPPDLAPPDVAALAPPATASPGSAPSAPPPPDRPAAAPPASATPPPAVPVPPASTPPVSAPAVSQPPVTTPSAGTPPTSAPPVSAPPVSRTPGGPDFGAPVSAVPVSTPPVSPPTGDPQPADDQAQLGYRSGPTGAAGGDTRRSGEAVEGAAGTASGDVGDGSGPVDAMLDPSADSGLPATDEQGAAEATDDEPAPEPPADPEQVLARFRWRLDPVTLRETVDDPEELREVRERLTEKLASALDNRSRARLLSLRAVASRVLNDLDDALADGRMALTYAEATGELRRAALAQARLAHVLRWRGEFAEADRLFAEANSIELPDRLRAALHEHAARCCYDQGRLIEACHHFERALDLRGEQDAELLDRVRTGLDAVASRAEEGGFGPYPRSWDEVLERDRTPVPARDGGQGLWGYADAEGDMVVAARYAEAQPFRDGLAWVRGPQTDRWSLINLAGETVLEPTYLAARPFSDGLAWVVRDESGWHAVDATGAVAVPPGFADVRPFHKGVAVVRREGWGAVDRTGRIVVPTRYHGFHTTLADGHHVDGFTEEGLAVVDLAGRKGVVDRSGQVIVAPAHPALLIHPVAFLATNSAGNWGALDRRGESLIDPMFHHPGAVVAEIDGLLADANPVL